MNKKLVLAMAMMSILLPIQSVLSKAQITEQITVITGTIYINADGSISPSTAPIFTLDNVTYTLTDNITGNVPAQSSAIIIQRDNITIDGAGYTLLGTRNQLSKGIELTGRSNVTIENMRIMAFDEGIYLGSSSDNRVSGNNITSAISVGVVLYSSSNNSIDGNSISNYTYGIELHSSSNNNSLSGNNIANNYVGIWLDSSHNNIISGNNMTAHVNEGIWLLSSSNNTLNRNNMVNDTYGIELESSSNNSVSGNSFVDCGLSVAYSYRNTVTDNLVNGKPLVYLEDVSDYAVGDADVGQLILVKCNDLTVENLNLSQTSVGVELSETNNTKISGNNITGNIWIGIDLISSLNNIISGNNITGNNEYALYLYSSDNNSVSGNNIKANGNYGLIFESSDNNSVSGNNIKANGNYGLIFESSDNNSVSGNNMTNNWDGVFLASSSDNSVKGNNMANNQYGILLENSSSNSIAENTVKASSERGISLFDSSNNNTVFHNNLINNAPQAVFLESYNNSWDDGYPSGGNYWSDYARMDLYSGVYQNATGTDGIGDTPYFINSIYGNSRDTDRYPLMNPFSAETDEIRTAYRTLLGDYNALVANLSTLNSTYQQNLLDYYSLQSNYTSLQNSLNTLNTNYGSLNSSFNSLNSAYDNLNATFNDYKTSTQNELSYVTDSLYVFIATTAILTVATVYFAERKPKTKTKAEKD